MSKPTGKLAFAYRTIAILEAKVATLEAASATQPAAGEPKWSCLNAWFLSLEPGRQAVLREDKWMLAGAAFDAGRQCTAPPAAAHGDDTRRIDWLACKWRLGGTLPDVDHGSFREAIDVAMRAQGDGEVQ